MPNMTENLEPDVTDALADIGSKPSDSVSDDDGDDDDDGDVGDTDTAANEPITPPSSEETLIPSPASVDKEDAPATEVSQNEENEPNSYHLPMSDTYVDEIEQSTDEDGHVNVSSDTGILNDVKGMDDAAIESEYDGILYTASFEGTDDTTDEVMAKVKDDAIQPIGEDNEPDNGSSIAEDDGPENEPKSADYDESKPLDCTEKEDARLPSKNDENVLENHLASTENQAPSSAAFTGADTADAIQSNNMDKEVESSEASNDKGDSESTSVADQPENVDDPSEPTFEESTEAASASDRAETQEAAPELDDKVEEITSTTEDREAAIGAEIDSDNEEHDDHDEPIIHNAEPLQPEAENEKEESSVHIVLDDIIDTTSDKGGVVNESNFATSDLDLEEGDGAIDVTGDTDQNGYLHENQANDLQESKDNLESPSNNGSVDGDKNTMEGGRDASRQEQAINNESSLVHTGNKSRSAPSPDSDFSSWRGTVIGLSVCFFLIIVAQGITIGILSNRNDDDSPMTTNDRGIGSSPTNSPTAEIPPTKAPTVTPTMAPNSETGFRSIANDPRAVRLELISECSEVCTESFAVPAAFDFRWSDSEFVRLMSISSNGNIILECDLSAPCGIIETLGYSLGMNVDTSVHGEIFVLPEIENDDISTTRQAPSARLPKLTVSWENLQLSAEFATEKEFQVSAQAILSEGKIEICYGEGNIHGGFLVASFLNITQGTSAQYPDGDPFSADDLPVADRYPTNQCFEFEDSDDDDIDALTMYPTPSSTEIPGNTPFPTTMAPTNPTFGVFVPLASIEDAIPLTSVSNCDDCSESIELPTEYMWDGKYPVSSLSISSNGFLALVGSDGLTEYVRINVISMDLDTSRDNESNVRYFRREPSGVTFVSWENMKIFDPSNTDNSRLNGQVLIHPEGRIDICWGEMFLENEFLDFDSNIYGYVDGRNFYATGPNFDSFGQSNGTSAPQNTCQTLVGDKGQTVSALYSNEFMYLSAISGSERLEVVSTFDDNEQIVELDVPIRWVQDTFTDRLLVTSNGMIRVDGCPTESSECGEIAVASADLDPSTSGDVWFLDATQLEAKPALLDPNVLYVISWENVSVFSFPSSRINAQALFYENGTIEICFGMAESYEISIFAGVFDRRFNIEEPAWGEEVFSFGGFTEDGVWPTGLCQSFYVTTATGTTQPGPTLPPISLPTLSPTDAPAPRCMPTSGACVSTESALTRELNEAREGATIALCGDMGILRTISVVKSNMTLCCLRESSWCALDGAYETQIMSVSGADFTVTGIHFQNGFSNQNGGNLAIDAPGHHNIRNCQFVGGQTSFMFGGNLFVANGDSISISDSNFDVGVSPLGGSGVAFENTWSAEIRNSQFRNNFGQGAGGGVLVHHTFDSMLADSTTQQLYIENSRFEENSAEIGGGLAVQDVDSINMTVLDTVFAFNVASIVGGALSVTGTNSTVATIRRNSGVGNSDASSTCQGFYFDENTDYDGGLCFGTEESILISDDDFPPDQTGIPTGNPGAVPTCTRSLPVCAETEGDLNSMLLNAQPNEVISLCGGMVYVSETLQVSQPNITICCEAYPRCTLSGTNLTAPIMSVTQGGNFTAVGLRFQSGMNVENGGNLIIDAPGYHSIQFCEFSSGFSESYGGSLYVGNANSVSITHSQFNSGMAIGGGAAAFVDTTVVSIEESEIVDNSARFEGGGFFFLSNEENSDMRVRIVGTTFEGNSATEGGGGFALLGRGSVQFTLLESWFYDNDSSAEGATGKISVSSVLNATFQGNYGDFNVDTTNLCEWIFIENESGGVSDLCFDVNSEAFLP
ncbi:unnamed protein product [Cylindrotheca closterium]|uniref:Uncharacterized protein n=1 Tax=Cylindrotheca closterium TaxID=2856 RepID=A0AAD2JKC2_9STRA|nr:unnamed protein product [Cylindrotheca closterium]